MESFHSREEISTTSSSPSTHLQIQIKSNSTSPISATKKLASVAVAKNELNHTRQSTTEVASLKIHHNKAENIVTDGLLEVKQDFLKDDTTMVLSIQKELKPQNMPSRYNLRRPQPARAQPGVNANKKRVKSSSPAPQPKKCAKRATKRVTKKRETIVISDSK